MTTIEDRADTIARGIWDARASTGTDTLSNLRDIVFKELAADDVRQASRREVEKLADVVIEKVAKAHPWADVVANTEPNHDLIKRIKAGGYVNTTADYISEPRTFDLYTAPGPCPCLSCVYERLSYPGKKAAHDA